MIGKRDGFTLVEVLVVTAILALLVALSLGAMAKVAHLRNQTESAARLRQWGIALAGYEADNGGDLPRRGQGVQPLAQLDRPEDWFNALPPYLNQPGYGALIKSGCRPRENDRSIFIRPGAKDPGGTVFLGYGMNMNLSPWNMPQPTKILQVERPHLTVFLAESPGTYASTYPSTRPFSCVAPHAGMGVVLFLDGHSAAFEADHLGVGKGDPQRDDVQWLTGTASDAQAPNYR